MWENVELNQGKKISYFLGSKRFIEFHLTNVEVEPPRRPGHGVIRVQLNIRQMNVPDEAVKACAMNLTVFQIVASGRNENGPSEF